MFLKRIPKVFYVVLFIWIMVIYNIANRWELINSENYFILEFLIYLLVIIAIIWGIIWSVRSKDIKAKKIMLFTLIIIATIITLSDFADTAKLYIDFTINYHAREEIAKKLIKDYTLALKTEEYPDSSIFLGEKYRKLSTQGYAQIWRDRGCVEVDFEVFDGSPHSLIDFFNYNKSGHITYVTEVKTYNLMGGTIQDNIITTKKIFGNWYFNLEKY